MFVCSIKAGKKRWIIVALAVILAAVTVFLAAGKWNAAAGTGNEKGYICTASTNDERIAFLAQFGWQVSSEPLEIRDVAIPNPFDEVYTKYNVLQKQQGFNLEPLAGKVCRQWVYEVTNYPADTPVHANLLIYEDRVVGGDICSTELNGFMLPFDGQDSGSQGMASSSAVSNAASGGTDISQPVVSSQEPGSSQAPVSSQPAASVQPPVSSQPPQASSSEIPANAWPTD